MVLKNFDPTYSRLFNLHDPESTGRSMLILNTFFACISNIFIAGTFYTGFLTANGIDIVRVGIINFIPYIAWIFSPLSPKLLSHFKHRRGLLLFNHIFFYANIVLATTLMPLFVKSPSARTVWFGVFLFIGHTSNALIGSGSMAWHLHFIPKGDDRNIYFSLSNLITAFVGTAAAIGAALLTDSLAHSSHQGEIIVTLRFVAFGLFLLGGLLLFLVPKEYPYPTIKKQVTIHELLTKPLGCKKFIFTALIAMLWNAICNLNASTWSYYILNTVGIRYVLTYVCSISWALGTVFFQRWWRGLIRRYSWFRILLLTVFVTGLLELPMSFATERTVWLYLVISVLQGFNLVGASLVFANVFYINLPKEDTDVFITFYNLAVNLSVLLGSMLGTWFLAAMERVGTSWTILGLPFYSSQFLVWIKFLLLMAMSFYIYKVTPCIQPDDPEAAGTGAPTPTPKKREKMPAASGV